MLRTGTSDDGPAAIRAAAQAFEVEVRDAARILRDHPGLGPDLLARRMAGDAVSAVRRRWQTPSALDLYLAEIRASVAALMGDITEHDVLYERFLECLLVEMSTACEMRHT